MPPQPGPSAFASHQRRVAEAALMSMGAYERHKRLMRSIDYYRSHAGDQQGGRAGARPEGGQPSGVSSSAESLPRSDETVLRETFRFIRSDAEDAALDPWEARLARRYYAKLYREFALADLSRYREGALGLRWRTQREVVAGRGQFCCGALGCDERAGLATHEVPFKYREGGQARAALVKLRLCNLHSHQLNYKRLKEREDRHRDDRPKRKRAGSAEALGESPGSTTVAEEDDTEFRHFLAGLEVG